MGFRFRKSINLGGGLKANVSKSGLGFSWGFKGFRISKTAKGTTRKTVTLPGTGLSYVDETKSKKNSIKNDNVSTLNDTSNVKEKSFDDLIDNIANKLEK